MSLTIRWRAPRITTVLASCLLQLLNPCRASAMSSPETIRIAADPALGAAVVVPLLLQFLHDERSVATEARADTDADGSPVWRLSTASGAPFTSAIGAVRESSEPFKLVQAGRADLVITAIPQERGQLGAIPGEWAGQRVLALEGLAMIANRSLGQQAIEARDIPNLIAKGTLPVKAGAVARPVRLYLSKESSDAVVVALARLGIHDAISPFATSTAEVKPTDVISKVSEDKIGIGILPSVGGTENQGSGLSIAPVGVGDCGNAFPLSSQTVLTEEYPLMNEVRIYAPSGTAFPEPIRHFIQQFIAFTTTDSAKRILRDAGYAVPDIEEYTAQSGYVRQKLQIMETLGTKLDLMGDFKAFVQNASQLSRIIRFGYDEADVNELGQQELAMIAQWAVPQQNAGRHILVAGFADAGGGNPGANLQLSQKRAEAVATILRQRYHAKIDPADSSGFGQLGYFGCPAGNDGDRLSRRVEIWLR